MTALRDPSTLSNYDKFRVTHTQVNFTIDFDKQILEGNVLHKVKAATGTAQSSLMLDTDHLEILGVKVNGKASEWKLLEEAKPFGTPLSISLNEESKNGADLELDIECQTTNEGTAIQFLTPTQARSQHPYMFSQCQAILARSVFPCQDTPDVKSTFEFNITSPLPVIASGLPIDSPDEKSNVSKGAKLYRFHQDVPIPSYLFALASGDIEKAPIGPRSFVATSPKDLRAAQWEFEKDTEQFIREIERIVYPYQWGTYNLLVLPPSFPYGGMENPIVTYCTPTVVSGDRENVDVIAHELSHSYSGNLVTAASWEHFWLNEGWTTYLERRLLAAVHGEPYRDFSAIIGWQSLVEAIDDYGKDHNFTKLIPNMHGEDPDDAFSRVPYDKGYVFLSYLESQVGKDKWDKFIPHYFTKFARQSIDSDEFKASLIEFFANDPAATASLAEVDWQKWYYAPGLPDKPKFDTSLADVCYSLADKWKQADPRSFEPASDDIKAWPANQVVVFLDKLLTAEKPLSKHLSRAMGEAYGLLKSKNVEVVSRFFRLALRAGDEGVHQPTAELLGNVGRMKFVRPLYVYPDLPFPLSPFLAGFDF